MALAIYLKYLSGRKGERASSTNDELLSALLKGTFTAVASKES
jgi:hypothetical protein